jgi:hypothetical protein
MLISKDRYLANAQESVITERLLWHLVKAEPSAAAVLGLVDIAIVDDEKFSHAAIASDSGRVTLLINKSRFNRLLTSEKIVLLLHEIGHVVLGHISDRSHQDDDRFLVAIAQDMALNSLLNKKYILPKWFVTPDCVGLPPDLSTEDYVCALSKIDRKSLLSKFMIPIDMVKEETLSEVGSAASDLLRNSSILSDLEFIQY